MDARLTPFGPYLALALEPEPPASTVLEVIQPEGLTRVGRVLAVGGLITDIPVGARVLCRPMTGMMVGGSLVLHESAVLGLVTEGASVVG